MLDQIKQRIGNDERRSKILSSLPPDAQSFLEFYTENPEHSEGLQAKLTEIITHEDLLKVYANPSRSDRVRLDSLLEDDATRFLTVFPTSLWRKLNDLELEIAIKHILGLPATNEAVAFCGVCKKEISPEDLHHSLTCVKNTPHGKSRRHDALTNVVLRNCRSNGITAAAEPRNFFDGSNKKPDGLYDSAKGLTFFETVVTKPDSPANLDANRGADQAQRRKQLKYAEELKEQGYELRVLSLDVFGKLSSDARLLVNDIAEMAEQNGTKTSKAARNDILDELSVCLHKMNSCITQRSINDHARYRASRNVWREVGAAVADVQASRNEDMVMSSA